MIFYACIEFHTSIIPTDVHKLKGYKILKSRKITGTYGRDYTLPDINEHKP